MNSQHLIDPEIKPALALFSSLEGMSPETLPEMRRTMSKLLAEMPVFAVPSIQVEKRLIPGPAGAPEIPVILYRPTEVETPLPAVLHIHGGGYMFGSAEANDSANQVFAAETPCFILSVNYRLAPETPHPGPVEDCYAALKWLYLNAAEIGINPARIAIKGESAGAGLAAALALLARDRGEIPICFQQLIYPMLDDRTCVTPDAHPYTGEFVWTQAYNRIGWACLLGTTPGGMGISPYAAPARADDLTNLPPAFISTGALDLFLEEDMDYTRRLSRAGIPVEFHVYPGAFHGFYAAVDARATKAANRDIVMALRRALHG